MPSRRFAISTAIEPADQCADHRLAAEEKERLPPVGERLGRILEPEEQLAADRRARDRRRDDPPARVPVEHVPAPAAQAQVQPESDDSRRARRTPSAGGSATRPRRDRPGTSGGDCPTTAGRGWTRPRRFNVSSNVMSTLFQDIRFGARLLLKDRTFTITALLTLAICLGANAAMFTVVRSVLLKPLPFPGLRPRRAPLQQLSERRRAARGRRGARLLRSADRRARRSTCRRSSAARG